MSVIGFDIGNESCVIAVAKHGGIDVLMNDETKRETPAVVSFGQNQRFLGTAGAAFATANPKSTVSQIKRLIGKLYKEVQDDLKLLPFATSEGPHGGVLIELEYLKKKWSFTPVEILGMLFKNLKQTAEKSLESPVVDCVIGVPVYFTDLQRREYLNAASIAGLKPLKLIHDGTAIALGYGMYKTDFSDSGPTVVMFVDIGHCDTQVTVAAFGQGEMNILSHSFDPNLGGKDFDEVLFRYFAAQFNKKYKIDVYGNSRASVRLRASCEKVKKVLSANAEAPISIECLIGDTDVRGSITREEFEKLSAELLRRIIAPCITALEECGLCVDEIHTVELVGSGSRVPSITRVLTEFFQKELSRTLNASECVARGCALACAILSPSLQVREYEVRDSFPYSIVLDAPKREIEVFPRGGSIPNEKMIKYTGTPPFSFELRYSNRADFPAGVSPTAGNFTIGGTEFTEGKKVKVEFQLQLNDNGVIEIGFARISQPNANYLWAMMGNNQMLNLPFSGNLYVPTTGAELNEALKKEMILDEQDLKVEQTKDQRNTLESFVYETRSKLSNAYKSFATDSEKEGIIKSLKETEDWLYEEDSDDELEQDYTGKLQYLKELLKPVVYKYEDNIRANAEQALRACIERYRLNADSLAPRKRHLVNVECSKIEQWLNGIPQKIQSPATLTGYLNHNKKVFESNCDEIIRPKTSFPWHEESVGPDRREGSDKKGKLEHLLERERSEDLDQRDVSENSGQRDQSEDSGQRSQSEDSAQSDQSEDSGQRDQFEDLAQKDQPEDSANLGSDADQREEAVNSGQREEAANSGQREEPVNSEHRESPLQVPPTNDVQISFDMIN